MNQNSARTDELGHEPTPTDTTTFARILEQSSLGTDASTQARRDGARTLAEFNHAATPWLLHAPPWADVAALQQDMATIFDSENQAIPGELWWRAAYTRSPNAATATHLAAVLEQRRQVDEAIRCYVQAVNLGDYVAAARLAIMCVQAGDLDLAHLLINLGRALLADDAQRERSDDLFRQLTTALDIQPQRYRIASYQGTDLLYYTACRILLAGHRDTATECLSTALLKGHTVAALTHGSLTLRTPTKPGRPTAEHAIAKEIRKAAKTRHSSDTIPLGSHSTTITKPTEALDDQVGAAIGGDRSAIERLLAAIQPLVVRYCRAQVGRQERSYASADDVAMEVCLAVLTALPSYRDQGRPFLAFVYGIAAHKVADAHRSAAHNKSDPVPRFPDLPEQHDGPEQRAMNGELSNRMARIMSTLPPKQREILVLRVVVGLSAEETADAVGSTPGAVRVAQHRALNRLRKSLAAEEND